MKKECYIAGQDGRETFCFIEKISSVGDNYLINDTIKISYKCRVTNTLMEEYSNIAHHAQIGDSEIGKRSSVGRYSKVRFARIGRYCSISWDVTIGALTHPMNRISSHSFSYKAEAGIIDQDLEYKQSESIIGNDVWIGCGATILSGIRVGDGAVIGAGAVVTHDVEPYAVVAGVPAKVIRYRFEESLIERLLQLKWWNFSDQFLRDHIELFRAELDERIVSRLEELQEEEQLNG